MAMTIRPRRSVLYMPASNSRAIEKARTLDADVIILDLEDAVAPDKKDEARAQAAQAVSEGGFGHREVVIRINGLDTPWGEQDLVVAAGSGVDAVLLPKVSSPATLVAARSILGETGGDLWAMIETTQAIVDLAAIVGAAATTRLTTLVAGTNDLAKEMRCRPGEDRAPLLGILTQIVLHARLAGLNALDGVCNTLTDEAVVQRECEQGLRWGFDGKTLIHPSQIAVANAVFTPNADEIAWARAIAAAFDLAENAGKGALKVDGKMVELLHLEEATRTLAIAEACAR